MPSPTRSFTFRAAVAVFLLIAGSSLWVIGHYGTLMPYFDQWNAEGLLLLRPWLAGRLGWGDLFRAFNEHHQFTTRLLTLLLFELNHQVWNVMLQEAVNAAIHAATLALLLAALLPACPARQRPLFLLLSTLILLVPVGWENLLCSFQTQIYAMMLFSLLLVTRLARAAPLTRAWWLALPWGLLGFLSQAPAVVTLALCSLLAFSHARIPAQRRRALAGGVLLLAATALAFALTPRPDTLLRQVYQQASLLTRLEAFGETLSWPLLPGCALIIWLPFALLLWRRLRRPPADDAEWMVVCLGLWVLAQCAGIAYGRGPVPMAARYQDILVMGLPVGLVSLLRWLEAPRPRWRDYLALLWAVAISVGMILQIMAAGDSLAMRHAQGLRQQDWISHYLAADPATRRDMAVHMSGHYPDIFSPVPFLEDPALAPTLPGVQAATTARQAGWVRRLTGALEPLGLLLMLPGAGWLLWQLRRRPPAEE